MPPSANQMTRRRLRSADAEAAAEVLARAFVNDPLWRFLFPRLTERATMVRQAFRAFAPGFVRDFVVLGVGAPLEGVAVWSPPNQRPPRLDMLLDPNFLALLFSPFLAALPRAAPVFSRFEALERRHAPEPHYHLSAVGVLPEAQGKGRASALIRPILAEADARGLPCYTETMTAENVPLYRHFGFIVREELPVPGTGLRIWALERPRLAGAGGTHPHPSPRGTSGP